MEKINFEEFITPSKEDIEESMKRWICSLRSNKNNFSYWYDKIKDIPDVPRSVVFALPDKMLSCLFLENDGDFKYIKDYFSKNICPVVRECFPDGECFMKNGCFSNKFRFNYSCHITDLSDESIIDHFMDIEDDAICFDTEGDLEVVFREYIKSDEGNPTMYMGMPFRTELRAFYDFDKKSYLYDVFYWNKDYCAQEIYNPNDREMYFKNYDIVFSDYLYHKHKIRKFLEDNLSSVDLDGKWSVDVLVDSDGKYRLIDMALAEKSAYYDLNKITK